MISITQPGFYTLIQDAGRAHYRSYGMPLSGVLDTDAYRLANWLVGNTKQEAVLEITLKGPVLKFHSAAMIGITGADLQPLLNGKPVPTNQTLSVPKDAVLQFGKCIKGCRAYLAFSGGLCLPKMMGSTATYTEAKVGGLSGVPLQKGDCIPLGNPKAFQLRKVPSRLHCKATKTLAVRVLPGPENTLFDKKSLVSFETSEYKIATASNRMGYRMEGLALQTFPCIPNSPTAFLCWVLRLGFFIWLEWTNVFFAPGKKVPGFELNRELLALLANRQAYILWTVLGGGS